MMSTQKTVFWLAAALCFMTVGAATQDVLLARWSAKRVEQYIVKDESGRGADIVLGNKRADSAPTCVGGLLDFNGLTDFAKVNEPANLQHYSEGVTMLAWVRPHEQPFARTRYIVHQDMRISMGLNTLDKLSVYVSSGGWKGTESEQSIPGDAWSHVGFSYDGKLLGLYVNGKLVKEAEGTGTIEMGGTRRLYLGRCSYADDNYWCGLLGTVEIFARPLSATAIQQRMKASRPKQPAARYKLKAMRVRQPLIANGGFERLAGAGFRLAGAWRSNTWGENTSGFSEEVEEVHSGKSCQKVEVTSFVDGGVVLCQLGGPKLKAGQRYKLELWLKGNESAGQATVWVRDDQWKSIPRFSRTFRIGTDWRKYRVVGKVETDKIGNVAISFRPERAGILWVDDVSLNPMD